jgi:sugar phosphate isomerase/epimerase
MGTLAYHDYSLEDALRGISAAGFRYVELSATRGGCEHVPADSDDEVVAALRQRLAYYGLQVSSVNGNLGLTTREGIELSKKAMSLASKLGAKIIVNTIGGPGNQEDLAVFLASAGEVAEHARRCGVTLGIEIHGEHTGNGALTLDVVRKVNHPNVKINYDTANCIYFSGTLPYEDLRVAVPETAHIHLKDKIGGKGVWNFPLMGMGETDFARVFRILDESGYAGPFSIEVEPERGSRLTLAETDRMAKAAYRNVTRFLSPYWRRG